MKFEYQRTVVAYHGCEKVTLDKVLLGNDGLKKSQNTYDWLGEGIYFWEYGLGRATNWAQANKKHPAVLGAIINLGNCFDLLDVENTRLLKEFYDLYRDTCQKQGVEMPKNQGKDDDLLLRKLDCAVINWVLTTLSKDTKTEYHTVRCVFSEGERAYDGSSIRMKSHVQIAVRNTEAILGYFKPEI